MGGLTIVVNASMSRDDIRPITSLFENTMNSLMWSDLLSQHRNSIVRKTNRIQGIDAVPRLHGSVRSLARKGNAPLDISQHLYCRNTRNISGQEILRARVRHQTRRCALVGSILDENHLSAAALFRRRSQQTHATGSLGLLECRSCAEEAGKASRGNEVVATGVSNARQGVVLGIVDYQATARAVLCGEGRVQPVRIGGDFKAERLE